ncbi:MAG: DUF6491 family protein [Lysobacteraceae bacterium]
MKTWTLLPLLLLASACATSAPQADSPELARYRAHAGAPVPTFKYFGHGHVESWKPFGERALAVWTHPNEAYLIDLDTNCTDLDRAMSIEFTAHAGVVGTSDDVLVRYPGTHLPCRIQTIRPLDTAALRDSKAKPADQDSGT